MNVRSDFKFFFKDGKISVVVRDMRFSEEKKESLRQMYSTFLEN
jgi:hypothetical protein